MTTNQPSYKRSEKWLEKRLCRVVKDAGGKAVKFSSSIEIGYPDRLVLIPGGIAVWVEVKSHGKKPRKTQLIRINELISLGFKVFVVSSEEDIDKFMDYFNERKA